jgi:integrase
MEQVMRVLTPAEYDAIKESIPKTKMQFQLEVMLNTGMRYVELQRFAKHPEWHLPNKKLIYLPSKFTKTRKERNVLLTPIFNETLKMFLGMGNALFFSSKSTMGDNLKRWAVKAKIDNPDNIAPKTLRKTWESWLVTANLSVMKILGSQGHNTATALMHYYTSGFTPQETEEIIKRTEGWG